MKRILKKLMAVLLACMLLLGSVTALAEEDYSQGIDAEDKKDDQKIEYPGDVNNPVGEGVNATNSDVTVGGRACE